MGAVMARAAQLLLSNIATSVARDAMLGGYYGVLGLIDFFQALDGIGQDIESIS
jgi:hypothetical protein